MLTLDNDALLKAVLGKEAYDSLKKLADTKAAIGKALSREEQVFVSANWQKLQDFVSSEQGQIATRTLVQDWHAWMQQQKKE